MRLYIKLRFRLIYMNKAFFFAVDFIHERYQCKHVIHYNTMILFIIRDRYNFREFNIRCYRYATINVMDRCTMYLGTLRHLLRCNRRKKKKKRRIRESLLHDYIIKIIFFFLY